MPYKRRYKKRAPARPGYVSCGKMVVSDAAKALALAKYLKGVVNVDYKKHDIQQSQTAVATTPSIIQLSNIAQGDTTNTRDGASVKIVSVRFSYSITGHASAPQTLVRIMLVCDKQTNEAIYANDDLLEDISLADNIVSPRNLNNQRRFNVLYDKIHKFSNTGEQAVHRVFHKKLQLKLRYDNSAAAITSLTQSSLSLVQFSDQATNTPLITSSIRLRYVDN